MALMNRSSIVPTLATGLLLCGLGCNDAEKPTAAIPPASGKMDGGPMGKMDSGKMDKMDKMDTGKMDSGKMDKMDTGKTEKK